MTKNSLKQLVGTLLAAAALLPYRALAQFNGAVDKLKTTAGSAGAGYDTSADPSTLLLVQIGLIIKIVIALTGVIFLGLTVYAGIEWMTAQGDTKKVGSAKEMIKNGIIGLIIVALAYAITGFVFNKLGAASSSSSSTGLSV